MTSYGVIQWLPTILIERAVSDRATAALAASIFFFGVPASILVPMASDRVGRRKPFLLIPSIIMGPAAYLTGTRTDFIFWPSALIFGLCLYGVFSLTYTLPAELVEEKLVGSAAGLVLTIGYLGSLAGPLIVGFLKGVTGTFDTGVLAISVAYEIAAILSLLLKETYKRTN
jgi:sugar phosphate permease